MLNTITHINCIFLKINNTTTIYIRGKFGNPEVVKEAVEVVEVVEVIVETVLVVVVVVEEVKELFWFAFLPLFTMFLHFVLLQPLVE